ncbi:MAG: hypothetical protein ACK41O_27635, partial [Runella zeae]
VFLCFIFLSVSLSLRVRERESVCVCVCVCVFGVPPRLPSHKPAFLVLRTSEPLLPVPQLRHFPQPLFLTRALQPATPRCLQHPLLLHHHPLCHRPPPQRSTIRTHKTSSTCPTTSVCLCLAAHPILLKSLCVEFEWC